MADRSIRVCEEFFRSYIRAETLGDWTLYAVKHQGIEYLATDLCEEWCVTSGADGTTKYHEDVQEVVQQWPAFAGLDLLVNAPARFTA